MKNDMIIKINKYIFVYIYLYLYITIIFNNLVIKKIKKGEELCI